MNAVHEDVEQTIAEPVPMNLRNPVTRHMKEWGYGQGYQHAHQFEDAIVDMNACRRRSPDGAIIPHGSRPGKAHWGKAGRDQAARQAQNAAISASSRYNRVCHSAVPARTISVRPASKKRKRPISAAFSRQALRRALTFGTLFAVVYFAFWWSGAAIRFGASRV